MAAMKQRVNILKGSEYFPYPLYVYNINMTIITGTMAGAFLHGVHDVVYYIARRFSLAQVAWNDVFKETCRVSVCEVSPMIYSEAQSEGRGLPEVLQGFFPPISRSIFNTMIELEWALGRAHTFAYHKIGH